MTTATSAGATLEGKRSPMLTWVTSVDHKKIGLLYMWTAAFFFLVAGTEAMLIRIQLIRPENTFLGPFVYNEVFTLHGTTMIFLVVVPVLLGLATYVTPLMIGARDMAFPRVNAVAYWF